MVAPARGKQWGDVEESGGRETASRRAGKGRISEAVWYTACFTTYRYGVLDLRSLTGHDLHRSI